MVLPHFTKAWLLRFKPSCNEDWKAFVWSYAAILPSKIDTVEVSLDLEKQLAFVWWSLSGLHKQQESSNNGGAAVANHVTGG
jgi:hypothetical protein